MGIWVDTDLGFDDLWALLVLRHLGVAVDGLSLVAGNAPLDQVARNAAGARSLFDFDWTISSGAAQPIKRAAETAERILGPMGMQSRGDYLPQDIDVAINELQLSDWLKHQHNAEILALGPLTNIAKLYLNHAAQTERIGRITWMGGSSARGNHTAYAEFNAIADPDALDILLQAGAPLTIIDLQLCRKVTFNENHVPPLNGNKGKLLLDLMGGYLDIALTRGRSEMSIYDPLAALAVASAASIHTVPVGVSVCTEVCEKYGQTLFAHSTDSPFHLASHIHTDEALSICIDALISESA